MENWKTIKETAKKFGIPEQAITSLIHQGELTYLATDPLILDADELEKYIESEKSYSARKTLEYELYCFFETDKNTPEYIPPTNKNFLRKFTVQHSTLYTLIIFELAKHIPREDLRSIFIEKSMGVENKTLAERHACSSQQITKMYKRAIDYLSVHLGDMSLIGRYTNEIKELNIQKQKNNILIGSLLAKIKNQKKQLLVYEKLYQKQCKYAKNAQVNIDEINIEELQILNLTIAELGVSSRIMWALKRLKIETVESLLRYIKEKGIDSLLNNRNYGKTCHEELITELRKRKIVNADNSSKYFKYL